MAIPVDKVSDRYNGPIGTLSPLAHINYLVQEARKTWSADENSDSQKALAFDAITKLIVSLELDDRESKNAVCNAMAFLLARLDNNFQTEHLQPMLEMQEKRASEREAELMACKSKEGGRDDDSLVEMSCRPKLLRSSTTSRMVMLDSEALDLLRSQAKEPEIPRLFINPSSWARVAFDVCVLFIVLIDSLVMPFQIAYHFDDVEESPWFWFGTVIFTVDIISNFFTGYIAGTLQKDHGQLVVSQRRIAMNYLRTWFLIDFFSTFPWSYAVQAWVAVGDSDSASGTRVAKVTKIVKLSRFMRLARMLKLLKLQSVWDAMENSIGNVSAVQVLNLVKVLAIIVYICHWNACIWWSVGSTSSIFNLDRDESVTKVEKWTLRQFKNVFLSTDGEEWTRSYSWADDDISAAEKYTFCFYWSLGVMRTMPVEVFPVNRSERLYTLVFMFFAFSLFSICISRVTQMYNKISARRSEFDENLAAVRYYMHEHDIDKELQDRIRMYLEYRFNRRRIFAKENAMFSELTETLWIELKCATFVRTLRTLWIFKDLSTSDLKAVVLVCSVRDAAPGDLISQANTVAVQASISMSGLLTSVDPSDTGFSAAARGASMLLENPLSTNTLKPSSLMTVDVESLLFTNPTLSSTSIWAFEFCDLAVIVKADFLYVRRTQPRLNAYIESLSKSPTGQDILFDMKKRDRDAGFNANQEAGEMPMQSGRRRTQAKSLMAEEDHGDGGAVVQALG